MRTQQRQLADLYRQVVLGWTDIQGHLDRFVEAARHAETIIELGVRDGVSTVAWLHGLDGRGHLWSVDIDERPELIPDLDNWTFIQGDDCSQEVLDQLPDTVDIVFVDTSHLKDHTIRELELYAPRVCSGGCVFLHDTELPGAGVKQAIEEFCAARGLSWLNYEHSYGLGVIPIP